MKICLVRHGESEANVGNFINDDPGKPVNLTERGKAQAGALANTLCDEPFTHAYVSEFPRAQQTIAILLRARKIPLLIDARLNERKSGLDGQPVNAFIDKIKLDPLHCKFEHGESFLEQMERLRGFLDELAARHPHAYVLAVSHENPILAALGLTSSAEEVVNGSIPNCGRITFSWPPINQPG